MVDDDARWEGDVKRVRGGMRRRDERSGDHDELAA